MTPVPNSTPPADGIQIILGSNGITYVGGIYKCRIQGNCPSGVGSPISFSGIMAGFELYYPPKSSPNYSAMSCAPDLFICYSGQCVTTPLPQINQPISGTLTVSVSRNETKAVLQLNNGSIYTITAPISVDTKAAEVSVTTGSNYATWDISEIKVVTSLV